MSQLTLSQSDLSKLLAYFAPGITTQIKQGTLEVADTSDSWSVSLKSLALEDKLQARVKGLTIQVPAINILSSAVEVKISLT
jgi:hypothetical protein